MALLANLHRKGNTIILVTHENDIAQPPTASTTSAMAKSPPMWRSRSSGQIGSFLHSNPAYARFHTDLVIRLDEIRAFHGSDELGSRTSSRHAR